MNFYNINNPAEKASFRQAVLQGAASGKGLFFPEVIPRMEQLLAKNLRDVSLPQLAARILHPFMEDDFSFEETSEICHNAFNFKIPLVPLNGRLYSLELFHGPSLAFKDVGARFLAQVLKKIAEKEHRRITVLVATSGDTGSAVARSFHQTAGIDVVLLYPSGKVSELQEKTLTTMGGNVSAFEVEGDFDACQRLVKEAFADKEAFPELTLTSANSINIGRFLPQTTYYFRAWSQLSPEARRDLIFSVPSGNYGNLAAGLLAYKMGLPANGFIAASNVNKVVPDYLQTGDYSPRRTVRTLSNAMDVGDPSNFIRIKELFHGNHKAIANLISGYVANDSQTMEAIRHGHAEYGYVLDPHGAIGFLAAMELIGQGNTGIFLETAHPGKFKDAVEKGVNKKIVLPTFLKQAMEKPKKSTSIPADYKAFKEHLQNLQ